jgi:hypothetical protein
LCVPPEKWVSRTVGGLRECQAATAVPTHSRHSFSEYQAGLAILGEITGIPLYEKMDDAHNFEEPARL